MHKWWGCTVLTLVCFFFSGCVAPTAEHPTTKPATQVVPKPAPTVVKTEPPTVPKATPEPEPPKPKAPSWAPCSDAKWAAKGLDEAKATGMWTFAQCSNAITFKGPAGVSSWPLVKAQNNGCWQAEEPGSDAVSVLTIGCSGKRPTWFSLDNKNSGTVFASGKFRGDSVWLP